MSEEPQLYRVRNWSRYQHYSKRNPPWIKLHYELLTSRAWVACDDRSRVLAIAIMLLASRNAGQIDGSAEGLTYLKRVAYLNADPDLKPLIACGFLEPLDDASNVLANVVSESESEAESEAEAEDSLSLEDGRSEHQAAPARRLREAEAARPVVWELGAELVRVPDVPDVFSAGEGPATECARLLAQLVLTNDPSATMPRNLDPWAIELHRLHSARKRPFEEIGQVIEWSQADPHWWPLVQNATDFTKHYQRMRARMLADSETPKKASVSDHNAQVIRDFNALVGLE